jgi:hypothetical protein
MSETSPAQTNFRQLREPLDLFPALLGPLGVHHVVKRSQGGSDFDLDQLVALCRWCHDLTDAPYERGRLIVTALGAGQFTFEVVEGVKPGTPPWQGSAFAHVGKNQPLEVRAGLGRVAKLRSRLFQE